MTIKPTYEELGQKIIELEKEASESKLKENLIGIQRDLSMALNTVGNLNDGLGLCLEAALKASGMDCGGVYLLDEISGALDLVYHDGLPPDFIKNSSHYDSDMDNVKLILAGEPVYTQHQELGISLREAGRQEHLRAIAVLPISYHNQVIACLNVASHSLEEVPFVSRSALESIAAQIGGGILRLQAEAALLESEERFRSIIENTDAGYFFIDRDGLIQDVNKSCIKMYGYSSKDEIIGQHFAIVQKVDDVEKAKEFVAGIMRGDTRYMTGEFSRKCKDGSIGYQTFSARPIQKEGVIIGLQCFIIDVTEHKQTEEALRESEEKYRLLIENQIDMTVKFDREGRFLFVSPSYCRTFGKTEDELIGKSFMPLVHEEDHGAVIKAMDNIFKPPHIGYVENRAITKDGLRWHSWLSTTILKEGGEVESIIAVGRDISDQKQAEKALRENEEKYRDLYDNAPDMFVSVDLKTANIIECNQTLANALGYEKEEIIGRLIFDIYTPDSAEHSKANVIPLIRKTGSIQGEEMQLQRKDGSIIDVSLSSTVVRDAKGNILYSRSVWRDITEKKKMEAQLQQAQKMEAIGTLAGGIAHDFNNVLYSIIGYTELTMDDMPEGSLAQKNLKEVLNGALRARDMIQRILAFSRKADTIKKPIKVQSVVAEALKFLRTSIPTTIEIRQDIDADCSPILADSTQIHQVVMNLATNAYQAMQEKGGVLEVNLEIAECGLRNADNNRGEDIAKIDAPDLDPGTYLKLTVSDTGHGMDNTVMDKIFDPYFTTKGPGEGTGMGLAVVHGIVKDHGGDIKVYSKLGEGTTFSVYLPLIKSRPVEQKTATAELAPTGTEHILFVDDEEALVFMTQQILERLGYQVTSRTSSVEALEAFRAKPDEYDLVITDMTMPNMTGVELSARLKEIKPDIPIILCTGFSEMIDEDKAKNMGIKAYIMKPILKDEIGGAIRKVLDG